MIDYIFAPWDEKLVEDLNNYQKNGGGHPYTCGYCRDTYGTRFIKDDDGNLIKEPNREYKFDENYNLIKPEGWKDVIILERKLIATKDGWICETCDNKQNWCLKMELV